MKMKKFFALLLSLSMVLSLAACGSKGNSNDSQTDGETASDLHLGYDINTGENHYGPYYDEWSDKTDEELFEEALKEDTTINVYATSSKMMKVEEGFEAAGYYNCKKSRNDRSLFDGILTLDRIEFLDHLGKSPGS